MAATFAVGDADDVGRAALACATLIEETSRAAAMALEANLPEAFAAYVRAQLQNLPQ